MGLSTLLAGLGGGLAALAAREAIRATPALAAWVADGLTPLRRAGHEGYAPNAAERRRLAAIGAAGILLAGGWLLGPGPAAPLAVAAPAGAAWAVANRRARYRRAVERGLPAAALAIADAVAGGRSVRAAVAASRASLEGSTLVELDRVAADLALGNSFESALGGMRERVRSPRVDSFCTALLSQRLAGGDLVGLLRRLAEAEAERDRVEADARSATAQARFTGLLVVAMPAGAGVLAELLKPGLAAALFANGASAALLAGAALLQLIGFAAIQRLSRVGGP